MKSSIKTYTYDDGEIQRVQIVECDDWNSLEFFKPKISPSALEHIASIYRDFFVPEAPYFFGEMIVFHIPEDMKLPFNVEGVKDRHIAAKMYLKKHYHSKIAKEFMNELASRGYLYIVKGKNKFVRTFMPYDDIGFISEEESKARLKVNSSFFIFDYFDVASDYDVFGRPFGLCIKNGEIINPPLFHREALLVHKDNRVEIKKVELEDLKINIEGKIYQRPDYRKTPFSKNKDVVIIKDEVVYIHEGGNTMIPTSGYIINTNDDVSVGDKIIYSGMEDIVFGIQCGNSIIIDNVKTLDYISSFHHLFSLGKNKYPPVHYPHDFNLDRAPRIALGESELGKPLIIWVEGASKMKHIKGEDSCGASLLEMANILSDLKIRNAINLDGGGSAQIEYKGKRSLLISDRNFKDNSESERPVPIGIKVN